MSELIQDQLSPDVLLFDPNNYRFQDEDGFVYAAEDRFHEESVQSRTYQRLRREDGLLDLKRSIMRNGYIPVERVVVRPYAFSAEQRWLVIEGNRRLAAVRWILDDYASGVKVSELALQSIQDLPVVILKEDTPNEVFRSSLMGIRHVSSIKQWGGYQRAKLIASMRDQQGLDLTEVAERLGLGAQEVNRRYKAFKALEQMQQDEEFGEHAKPTMYPLFHEAIALPVVRKWLDWGEARNRFQDEENLRAFYELITPKVDDEGTKKEPKITTYFQVRELREILPRPEAKRLLLDAQRPFEEAASVAQQEKLSHLWATDVSAAIRSLEAMGVQELKGLTGEDVELLKRLAALISERLRDRQSLKRKK